MKWVAFRREKERLNERFSHAFHEVGAESPETINCPSVCLSATRDGNGTPMGGKYCCIRSNLSIGTHFGPWDEAVRRRPALRKWTLNPF